MSGTQASDQFFFKKKQSPADKTYSLRKAAATDISSLLLIPTIVTTAIN